MLDNKDKKILSILVNNARMPRKKLSKEIHMSRELVDYHIKKLEKSNIITGYQVRSNLNAFCLMGYNLLLKLGKYDKQEEEKFIQFLKDVPYIHYMVKIGGEFDFLIAFTIQSKKDLQDLLSMLYENYSHLIEKHELFTMLYEIKDNFASIFDEKNTGGIVSMKELDKPVEIDNIDKSIIRELTKNARISSVDLGYKLNLTSAAVAYRIKNLEKKDVILGYRTVVDIIKMKKQFYYVYFSLKNPTKENEAKMKKELESNPDIGFANRLAGSYDYQTFFHANDNKDFYNKLKEVQNRNPQMTKVNVFLLLEFLHHDYNP